MMRQTSGTLLRHLADRVRDIADGNAMQDISIATSEAARGVLRDEFRTATDPYGSPWAPLAHGHRQPLAGKKLPNTFRFIPIPSGGFRVESRGKVPVAHQEGARIPARQAGGQEMYYRPSTGKLIKASAARRLKLVYVSTTRRHRIGEIILPQRQLLPTGGSGGAGPRWDEALRRAALQVVSDIARTGKWRAR